MYFFYRGSVFQTMITEQHTNGKIEKRISNEGEKAEKSQVHIIYHPIRRRVHNHIQLKAWVENKFTHQENWPSSFFRWAFHEPRRSRGLYRKNGKTTTLIPSHPDQISIASKRFFLYKAKRKRFLRDQSGNLSRVRYCSSQYTRQITKSVTQDSLHLAGSRNQPYNKEQLPTNFLLYRQEMLLSIGLSCSTQALKKR